MKTISQQDVVSIAKIHISERGRPRGNVSSCACADWEVSIDDLGGFHVKIEPQVVRRSFVARKLPGQRW